MDSSRLSSGTFRTAETQTEPSSSSGTYKSSNKGTQTEEVETDHRIPHEWAQFDGIMPGQYFNDKYRQL
jgi:hypothetical protein